MSLLKSLAARLPARWQQELKRLNFALRPGSLISDEPEFARLEEWVKPGDHVLDIGANVGSYTIRLSHLVGPRGRVFAFEPGAVTFELLTANVGRWCPAQNVTLFNAAASHHARMSGMAMPTYASGLANIYEAHLTDDYSGAQVYAVPIDNLGFLATTDRIALVKLDVEGHELHALYGMTALLTLQHPRLIVEGRDREVAQYLAGLGYGFTEHTGSPNRVYERRTP